MTSAKRQKDTDNLIARVIKPAGLVSYQAGAIVSRTIIDKETGMLTLFAFDAG